MVRLFYTILLFLCTFTAYCNPKNPKIMVIPADNWCQEQGFWKVYENQGEIKGTPNYEQAFRESRELKLIVSKINNLMLDRGFPLADMSQSMKNDERRSARNSLATSKTSDSPLSISPLDELNRQAKADIYIEVDYGINTVGPKHSIVYNIRALDAYTGKQIAGAEGTGKPTYTSEISVLLEEAVTGHMDNFISRLQSYFDDCIENGREIVLELGMFDKDSDVDFESEFNGVELSEIIENWLSDNTVNKNYLTSEKTGSNLLFENVRIPLQKKDEKPQDAGSFANDLRKYLLTKYGIQSKNNSPSLGYAQIIIESYDKTRDTSINPNSKDNFANRQTSKNSIDNQILSDVDIEIPKTNLINPNQFALIIANENYQDVASVPFALNDGETLARYCHNTLGMPETNIHLVKDATLNNIKRELNVMKKIAEAYGGEASFLVYYAGHGIPDEKSRDAFLMPVDGYPGDVSTCLSLNDFYSSLSSLPSSKTIVLLDACFSGASRDGDMLMSARGVALKPKSPSPSRKMLVISSASGDETSYPYEEKKHGLFTYFLLKILKESEGNTSIRSIMDYVYSNVTKTSIVVNGKSQTPVISPSSELGDDWNNWKLN